MWKLSDTLLFKKARLTNTTLPHSDIIDRETYPQQINGLPGSTVSVKVNTHYKCNIESALEEPASIEKDGEVISLRPEDDLQFLTKRELTGPDFVDIKDYWEEEFLVLRADLVEPYVFIGISTNYSTVIVGSTKMNDQYHYDFLDNVYTYPVQANEYFNLVMLTHYMNDQFIDDFYYDAIALRVDSTDPALAVIMEYIDDDNVRFILTDEVIVIDVFDDSVEYITDIDIPEYRRKLLEGKIIYGTIQSNET